MCPDGSVYFGRSLSEGSDGLGFVARVATCSLENTAICDNSCLPASETPLFTILRACQPLKHRYLRYFVPASLENTAQALLGAACALEVAATGLLGAACVLENAATGQLGTACVLEMTVLSLLGATLALEIAAAGLLCGACAFEMPVRACSVPPVRSTSLPRGCSAALGHSEELLQMR